ncbi:hypothetical protein GCM10023216_11690 [Isoptericola chiayiensis]|uniref:histidine kinase n=1 Tax=Isoptericola chiayiensis TaxID=579446 RepID=A0ABP8YBJ8_9MICO|nr:signal transduction histidine kinase [Isoptericola chiayiensis]
MAGEEPRGARVRDRFRRLWGDGRRGDLSTAVVTFVAGCLLLAVGLTDVVADPPLDLPRGAHLGLLTAGCVLVALKRARPLLALAGGSALTGLDLAGGGSLALLLVLWDLLYSAALWARATARDALWMVAGAITVVGGVTAAVVADDPRALVHATLQLGALLLVPLWWAQNVRQKTELVELERARADAAARSAALERARAADHARLAESRRVAAVRSERAAMARDLHDVVAGHLSTIAIHSGAALNGPPDPDRDRAALEQVRVSALDSLGEMRSMIDLLRAGTSDSVRAPGRLDEIAGLVQAARSGGVEVSFVRPAPAVDAGTAAEQALHRIAQEALTNARKHAPGRPVEVRLDQDGRGTLHLDVRNGLGDGGRPGASDEVLHSGIGILTMAERAEALGGSFRAGPENGSWVVHAAVPRAAEVPVTDG